jgi:hypothetical protein
MHGRTYPADGTQLTFEKLKVRWMRGDKLLNWAKEGVVSTGRD